MDRRFFRTLFFGPPSNAPVTVTSPRRLLFDAGMTKATAVLGAPGTSKTFTIAQETWEIIKDHPDYSVVIYEWGNMMADTIIALALSDPQGKEHLHRFIFDPIAGRKIGQEEWVMPLPAFSAKYDPEKSLINRLEDQIDRVRRTFEDLYKEAMLNNPTMIGRPITSLLPNLCLLAAAYHDELGYSWQMSEIHRLLNPQTRIKVKDAVASKVGKAYQYFEERYKLGSDFNTELETALLDIIDVINSSRIRARIGANEPGYTPREVFQGMVLIVDGSGLSNNELQRNHEFLRHFNLFDDEVKKRRAGDPTLKPVVIAMDECYTFTEIPSMASKIAHYPSEMRNRKIEMINIYQSLKQLAKSLNGRPGLDELFFSFGNIICFALLDIEDAIEITKNFFPFDPLAVKVPARTDTQHNIMENVNEQVMIRAYELMMMPERECYIRRFITEGQKDRIIHVRRTRDARITVTPEEVERFKDELVMQRGMLFDHAKEIINNRNVKTSVSSKAQQMPG
jgi:hypothetical protein